MTAENEPIRKDPARNDPSVPEKVRGLIQGLEEKEASTALSEHRTGLSEHRTKLSEHRTDLSEHRTGLSEHRTDLSEHRTDLSEKRTGMSEHRTMLSDTRSYLANERTHLAYLRTSISLMSFGITLNRFSIYLIENNRMPDVRHPLRDTENLGLWMLILGVVMMVWSLFRFRSVNESITKEAYVPVSSSLTAATTVLIFLGVAGAIWIVIRS